MTITNASHPNKISRLVFCIAFFSLLNFNSSAHAAGTQKEQDGDAAERVRITTEFVRDCVSQVEKSLNESEIRQMLVTCVNTRLAKEGKPWRWNANPADVTINKQ